MDAYGRIFIKAFDLRRCNRQGGSVHQLFVSHIAALCSLPHAHDWSSRNMMPHDVWELLVHDQATQDNHRRKPHMSLSHKLSLLGEINGKTDKSRRLCAEVC